MSRNEISGVLDAGITFDEGLSEITDLRCYRNNDPKYDALPEQ
jgi:hypothetical protein